MSNANIIPWFVIIPLFSAFFISLVGRYAKKVFVKVFSVLSVFALLIFSFYAVYILRANGNPTLVYKIGGWVPPFGICMVLDGLTNFKLVTVNLVAFFISVYSFSYMEKYTDKPKFFTLFFLMLCGMNGLIVTGDLFNLFVFLEIASISSYALVAYGKACKELR